MATSLLKDSRLSVLKTNLLVSDKIVVGELLATNATIDNLMATNATIDNLDVKTVTTTGGITLPASSFSTIPSSVGLLNQIGSANLSPSQFATGDHVHQGVHSLSTSTGLDQTQTYGDIKIVSGSGITIDKVIQDFTINNTGTYRKYVAGETITIGSCTSVLNGLAYQGFSDTPSKTIDPSVVNFIQAARMSDQNFVLAIAKPNSLAFQVGVVVPVTYIGGIGDAAQYLVGVESPLPTTGLTNQDRISNAFSVEALDATRFVVVYQDTSGTATTATINRVVAGTFTPGAAPATFPIATLATGSVQTYGTTSHTITQSSFTITSALAAFTSDMVGMQITYTSGPSSGSTFYITAFTSATSIDVDTALAVPTASQFSILYATSTATRAGGTGVVTGNKTVFTASMVGSELQFTAGVASLITVFTDATHVTTVDTTAVVIPAQFTINYITGTIAQTAGGAITGTGTVFTNEMVGGTLTVTSGPSTGQTRLITAFTSGTSITTPANTAIAAGAGFSLAYRLGMISQTTTVITGRSTLFTSAMNRGILTYITGNPLPTTTVVAITGFTSATSLTTTPSQTAAVGATFQLAYQNGLVGQTSTTVTGTGTTFTAAMVGGILTYTSGASSGVQTAITGFTNATTITVSSSATVLTGTSFSISFGQTRFSPTISPSVAITTQRNFRIIKLDTDVCVAGYRDNTNLLASFWILTFVGTNIAFTSATPASASINTAPTGAVAGFEIGRVDATHFLGIYNNTFGDSTYVLGDTTPTLQPAVVFLPTTAGLQSLYYIISPLMDNKLILFFQDQTDHGKGTAIVFTVAGLVVTPGPRQIFYNGGSPAVLCFATLVLSPTKVTHFFVDVPNGSIGKSIMADISGTSVVFSNMQTFSIYNPSPICTVIDTNTQMYIIFKDAFDNSCQIVLVPAPAIVPVSLLLNYTQNKGLRGTGIAQNSALAGQTVATLIVGDSPVHSNLVPNEDYFCHGDGSLTQFADPLDRTYVPARVGLSISGTEIIIRLTS